MVSKVPSLNLSAKSWIFLLLFLSCWSGIIVVFVDWALDLRGLVAKMMKWDGFGGMKKREVGNWEGEVVANGGFMSARKNGGCFKIYIIKE